jgi:hypothetical protein
MYNMLKLHTYFVGQNMCGQIQTSIAPTTQHWIVGHKLAIAKGKAGLNCIAYFPAKNDHEK